uniref:Uncharacterized protein n=1 Tax=Anguilla anguilla TaxID=7936 RepID=A0A0E9T361_ANGAN
MEYNTFFDITHKEKNRKLCPYAFKFKILLSVCEYVCVSVCVCVSVWGDSGLGVLPLSSVEFDLSL